MKAPLMGGILLVAGTSIGAGMLALPVVTAAGGFFPAFVSYLVCWAFMTSTGLLLLEISLGMPPDANLITMAGTYLGRGGKIFAWVFYLFLFYCLSMAYLAGGGGLLKGWVGPRMPSWGGSLIFLSLLAPIVYLGAKAVDRVNAILMGGLIFSYLAFVFLCLPFVEIAPLARSNWSASFGALPVIFTAFSFQGIIPTLTNYLKRDAKLLRLSIIGGTSAAFLIYLVWEFVILGTIPFADLGRANELGLTAIAPLGKNIRSDWVTLIGQAFAFFAIATSFLGVTLGLLDFLADGLRVPKIGIFRARLALLTFAPPLLVTLFYPSLFITALSFAGGIGCALLLGVLPIVMIFVSRRRPTDIEPQLGGGKPMLFLLLIFVLFELGIEVFPLLKY